MKLEKLEKKNSLYGVSSQYTGGRWIHEVIRFTDLTTAQQWLKYGSDWEPQFRERELMSKTAAIRLAGARAVRTAPLWTEQDLISPI